MGILDEAIREHLELKRQHGAAESELKQLEDEAFGPPGRPGDEEAPPDTFSEAPTEFMAQPAPGEPAEQSVEGEPETRVEDMPEDSFEQPRGRREPAPELTDLQEAPEAPEPAEPSEEEAPAMEHEAVRPEEIEAQRDQPEPSEGEPAPGPSTEERRAIADQPTELYDVAGEEFGGSEAASQEGSDEQEDDDFFDEKRLSDELDQALEAPGEAEPEEDDSMGGEEQEGDAGDETGSAESVEDLLEETPDFLEEAPEDDRLWFEQQPPKDFDFDD